MAVNIGPKIGIDGEAKYRQEMKAIIQQSKTLSAEMTAVASSFQNADDKETELQKASKVLNDQLKNQRELCDKLADAVKKSATETGENSETTNKWKEQLYKAQAELSKLEGTTAESAVGMKDLAENEKDAGKEADNASGKVSAFTVALGQLMADAIKEGFTFMVDSLKQIGQYFVDATKGAAAYADEITTLSKQTGMSTDALQEYRYMADLTDTSLETITGSLTKLEKNMGSAAGGSKSAQEAFASLGIELNDSEGNLRSANDVFLDAITALGNIDNETERDIVAMSLFGKSAKDLNPLIETGADNLAAFSQEAHDVGYVLDEDTLDSLGAVQDGFDRLGLAADSLKNQIGATIGQYILPYLNDLVAAVQALVGGGSIEDFANSLSALLANVADDLSALLPDIITLGTTIIQNLLQGISESSVEIAYAAADIVDSLARFVIDNLPTLIETALNLIIYFAEALAEKMPELIPAAIQMILTIVDGLLSHIGEIIAAALELIQGIVDGLTSPEGINAIIQAIPTLITSLIEGILSNLGRIVSSAINIIFALVKGLIMAIPELVKAIPQIIMAIVNAFKDNDWAQTGADIMEGLSEGVKSTATIVWEAVTTALEKALDWIRNLGKSALEWGKDMINGFADGVMNKAKALLDKVKSVAQSIKGFLHFSRPDVGPLRDYEKWMPDFMKGLASGIENNAWRVQDALKDATGGMVVGGNMRGSTTNYGGVSINVYAQPGQDVNGLADVIMQKMQGAVNRREAVFA